MGPCECGGTRVCPGPWSPDRGARCSGLTWNGTERPAFGNVDVRGRLGTALAFSGRKLLVSDPCQGKSGEVPTQRNFHGEFLENETSPGQCSRVRGRPAPSRGSADTRSTHVQVSRPRAWFLTSLNGLVLPRSPGAELSVQEGDEHPRERRRSPIIHRLRRPTSHHHEAHPTRCPGPPRTSSSPRTRRCFRPTARSETAPAARPVTDP